MVFKWVQVGQYSVMGSYQHEGHHPEVRRGEGRAWFPEPGDRGVVEKAAFRGGCSQSQPGKPRWEEPPLSSLSFFLIFFLPEGKGACCESQKGCLPGKEQQGEGKKVLSTAPKHIWWQNATGSKLTLFWSLYDLLQNTGNVCLWDATLGPAGGMMQSIWDTHQLALLNLKRLEFQNTSGYVHFKHTIVEMYLSHIGQIYQEPVVVRFRVRIQFYLFHIMSQFSPHHLLNIPPFLILVVTFILY